MNKAYKLIWSKVRACYVVVSEIAKIHKKSSIRRVVSCTVAAGILSCILGGMVSPVFAEGGITATNTNNVTGKEVYNYLQDANLLLPSADFNNFIVGNALTVTSGTTNLLGNNSKNSGSYSCFGVGNNISYSSSGSSTTSGCFTLGNNVSISGFWGHVYSIAIGNQVGASSSDGAGGYALVLGNKSSSSSSAGSLILGYNSRMVKIMGYNNVSVSIGNSSYFQDAARSIGIGTGTFMSSSSSSYNNLLQSVSIGHNSFINDGYNSVAIGTSAGVTQGNNSVVSFGHGSGDSYSSYSYGGNSINKTYDDEYNGRLVHISKGINDTDAINVSQLNEAIQQATGSTTPDSQFSGYTAGKGIDISKRGLMLLEVLQSGVPVSNLVQYGLSNEQIEEISNNWNNGNYNLEYANWNMQVTPAMDCLSTKNVLMYNSDANDKAMLTGANGSKLTNLKARPLSRFSKDAVIGNQLWTTNQNMEGMKTDINMNITNIESLNASVSNAQASVTSVGELVDTVNQLKADVSLSNLDNTGRQVIASAAENAVQEYMAENNKLIMNKIVPDDNSSVIGGETYSAVEDMKSGLQDKIGLKADVSYVDKQLDRKANLDDVYLKDKTDLLLFGKADANSVYAKADVNKLMIGKADTKYVDDELLKKADITYVNSALDTKADKSDLEAKANNDASNIDVSAWSSKLGFGEVVEDNKGLVMGDTVYRALKEASGNDMVNSGTYGIEIGSNQKYDNLSSVSVAKSDGTGRVLRNVITNSADDTSVATVDYVNTSVGEVAEKASDIFENTGKKINRTGAGAAALANLHPVENGNDIKWSVAAGVGHYHGETTGAIGVFYKPSDKLSMNISSTVGNEDTMFGAGIAVGVDKSNGHSKTEMAKEIQALKVRRSNNKQALQQMQQIRQQDRMRIAQLEKTISEFLASEKEA